MSLKAAADTILGLPWLDDDTYDRLKASIDVAIATAVAEEREACAQVVLCTELDSPWATDALCTAAKAIRARSHQ